MKQTSHGFNIIIVVVVVITIIIIIVKQHVINPIIVTLKSPNILLDSD
jgi:hypothetical protein